VEAYQTPTFRPGSICTYKQTKSGLGTAVGETNRHLAILSLLDFFDFLSPLDLVFGHSAQEHQSQIPAVDLRSVRVAVVVLPQLHIAVHVGYDQRHVVTSERQPHFRRNKVFPRNHAHTELSS